MIQGFSNFSKGWGAKIILGLLTLSMIVVWGLGGFLNTNVYGQKPAIEVGSDTVSIPELMNAFNAVGAGFIGSSDSTTNHGTRARPNV